MGILEDLFKNSTGLMSGLLADKATGQQSTDETSMDVSYDPQQKFKDPYTTTTTKNPYYGNIKQPTPFTIDPKTGKRMINGQVDQSISPMTPSKKPNDIAEMAKNPGMFERIFGMDTKTFAKNWQDKGGYEGLMANPAFLLGLGIIQSSAQGKPIGSDIFDIAVKSGAISSQYADRIRSRASVLGPVTDAQRDMVRSVLAESDLAETADVSTKIKNLFKGKNTEALNRRALDDVADRALKLAKAESAQRGGQEVRLDRRHIETAVKQLKDQGIISFDEKGFLSFFFGRGIQSTAKGLAKGGPVTKGEDYIVGEEGPEMFVPEVDGNIIKNDDSKVINMLLESNPQLKNVSRARAVKILKARFPDYF